MPNCGGSAADRSRYLAALCIDEAATAGSFRLQHSQRPPCPLAILVAAALTQAAETPDYTPLTFLTGRWRTEVRVMRNGPYWTEEIWTDLAGHMMLGLGRTLRGVDSLSFEYMRIARGPNGGVAFYGQPNGVPAIAFQLVRASANEAVFENPAHDFPQRIAYRREGDTLTATVSLMNGGNAQSWRFTRQRPAD